jgi:hypothetical protein
MCGMFLGMFWAWFKICLGVFLSMFWNISLHIKCCPQGRWYGLIDRRAAIYIYIHMDMYVYMHIYIYKHQPITSQSIATENHHHHQHRNHHHHHHDPIYIYIYIYISVAISAQVTWPLLFWLCIISDPPRRELYHAIGRRIEGPV